MPPGLVVDRRSHPLAGGDARRSAVRHTADRLPGDRKVIGKLGVR